MKKLFSVFLCLTVWLSASAYDFEVDGIYYNIIGNGQVEVTDDGYYSYSDSVIIPPSVTNSGVTYSVTSIGDGAFASCSGLTSVTIPNSVTSIGDYAFAGIGLTSMTIPNSVTSIGDFAFSTCIGLTSMTIPNSVTSIGNYAFHSCDGLTSVTIGNGVTSIGDAVFCYCYGLASVIIGNGVTSIGCCAFQGCYSLTSVTIPDSVTTIGEEAFIGCNGLTSVTIGKNVNTIGDGAFANCSNIMDIKCYAPVPPIIKQSTFANYDAALYVPANSVDIYSSTKYWEDFFIRALPEDGLEYNLTDRNVIYVDGRIYNENSLDIMLFDVSGRLISSGNGDIEMSSCPIGIYIVTDGKGGFLKINHYR